MTVAPAVIDMGAPLLRTSIAPFVTPFDYGTAEMLGWLRSRLFTVKPDPCDGWRTMLTFYFPAMGRDEVVLIKGYDSTDDGRARFTPHTAFDDPTTTADAPARESIEVRALAFFDD